MHVCINHITIIFELADKLKHFITTNCLTWLNTSSFVGAETL